MYSKRNAIIATAMFCGVRYARAVGCGTAVPRTNPIFYIDPFGRPRACIVFGDEYKGIYMKMIISSPGF